MENKSSVYDEGPRCLALVSLELGRRSIIWSVFFTGFFFPPLLVQSFGSKDVRRLLLLGGGNGSVRFDIQVCLDLFHGIKIDL